MWGILVIVEMIGIKHIYLIHITCIICLTFMILSEVAETQIGMCKSTFHSHHGCEATETFSPFTSLKLRSLLCNFTQHVQQKLDVFLMFFCSESHWCTFCCHSSESLSSRWTFVPSLCSATSNYCRRLLFVCISVVSLCRCAVPFECTFV